MKSSTKKICINGIGIALFVVLTMCVQVPVFENYYICLGYVIMALYCYIFGPISGTIVGCVGTMLYCTLTGGFNGMPGWTLGNLIIGIMLGIACKSTSNIHNNFIKYLILVATIILSTAIGILIIKSLTEVFLYAHPFFIRVAKNFPAFISDVVILIVGLPVCAGLEPTLRKQLHISTQPLTSNK
jgi:ECF transporter S component (folate family)